MRNRILTLALGSVLMLGASAAALAQDNPPPPPPDQGQAGPPPDGQQGPGPRRMDPDRQLQHMTRMLNLTPDQQSQIKPILVDRQQKLEALFQNQSLAPRDRRAQMRAINQDMRSKVEAVLTGDQKQKYEAMQEHRGRRGGYGNEGAPPPPPDNSPQQ